MNLSVINQFSVLRLSDLKQDYAWQKSVECGQLAAFMATTQLLANYSCAIENQRTL